MDNETAYERMLLELREMKRLLNSFGEKLERKIKLIDSKSEERFVTVKEMAYLIKKDRKTVANYCKEYPEIRRKKEGRENLVHQIDFQKSFEKGRKTPFNREVFNTKKAA